MAKTEFIWDVVTGNVMMEKDGAGNTQAVYTQEPYQYGRLISQRRGNQTSYYHFDGNGNTRALTDAGENVTDTYIDTAFGDEVATTGTTPNRYRYAGQYGYQYNEPTQDYYVRERVYEPTRGRWTSKDPLRFIDGANMYLFVDNRPTAFFDPSGAATTVSTTVACPSCDAACTKLKCYWDNAIADMKAHVRISFLKEIRDDKGKGVTTTKCRVDRGFSGIGAAKGKPQLVLILTFADGTTTGNFGKRYSELRSKHGATFHGNLVTPRPGVRPYIQISKEHKGRKLASVEFQERLQLDCTCGGAEQQVFWCFNLKWSKGATSGWEKVVPRGTDCHKIMPKEKEDRKPVPAPRPWANH